VDELEDSGRDDELENTLEEEGGNELEELGITLEEE